MLFSACLLSDTMIIGRGPDRGGLVCGMVLGTAILLVPSIFMFVGAGHLRSGRSRGLVITGVVFDFIMCALMVLAVSCGFAGLAQGPQPTAVLALIQILLAGGGAALGIVAGVKTLTLISSPDMQTAFESHAPSRGWEEDIETDWERSRRRRRREDDGEGV
jgi:hypothetical protein